MTANTKPSSKLQINKIKNKTSEYYFVINTIMNKYNISSENRISHFLGQGAVESGSLLSMQEVSQLQIIEKGVQKGGRIVDLSTKNEAELGHWYGEIETENDNYFSGKKYNSRGVLIAGSYSWKKGNCGDVDAQKYRGRGFKMLTGLDTYSSYWVYRGWLSTNDFDQHWWYDHEYKEQNASKMKKRPPQINLPQKITENPYNCIDTGGFFIAGFKGKTIKEMDADKGLAERKIFTKKAKEVIGDDIY